jgi:lipopolysaccharide/colanic/teichoic acid biosynthesis glycosyltransferase
MSLVGPVPGRPTQIYNLGRTSALYRQRYRAKAGVTGLAQVVGWNRQLTVDEQIQLDSYYIENWSMWLDVKIILRTTWLAITGRV